MRCLALVALTCIAGALGGCGLIVGFDDLSPPDGGVDGNVSRDARPRTDASRDAARDVGVDVTTDGGRDATRDGRADAGSDARTADALAMDSGSSCGADLETDPSNCGACGHACDLRAPTPCLSGSCAVDTLWTKDASAPIALATDDASVYWANVEEATVLTASLDGGVAVTLASEQFGVQAIALSATSVYWLGLRGLVRHPKSLNSDASIVADGGSSFGPIIVSDGFVAYPTGAGIVLVGTTDAGGATVLPGLGASSPSLALAGGQLIWAGGTNNGGNIAWASIDGGGFEVIASGLGSNATGLTATDAGIYFAVDELVDSLQVGVTPPADAALGEAGASTDAGALRVLTRHSGGAAQLVVGGANIYFGTIDGLLSVPLAGGTVTTLCTNTHPSGIALTATHVYWVDEVAGALFRAQRPQ